MDDQKIELLLDRLTHQTEKGLLNWKTTGSEDTFLLVLKDSSISISTEFSDELSMFSYVLQFRNKNGEIVENTYIFEETPYYKDAEWLYELVRRQGLNSDGLIDSILEQLNSDQVAA